MSRFALALWFLTATPLFCAASQAQSDVNAQIGMMMDQPLVAIDAVAGKPQPMPLESPVADPRQAIASASLSDLKNDGRSRLSMKPTPLPEELK
jgi:hypothetical protein